MKITLLTYGSQGDVIPFAALGKALAQAGHQITLAAPEKFRFLVDQDQIEYAALPGDPQQMVQDLVSRAGNNWWRIIRTMSSFVLPLGIEVSRIAHDASRDADIILHSFLLTNTGYEIAREMDIPDLSVQTFPVFASTAAFPAPVAPDLPLGGLYRRLTHGFVTQTFWQGSRLIYSLMRKEDPLLPPLTSWPFNKRNDWQTPILYAFSPSVIPRPEDWHDNINITGYWFDDFSNDWTPQKGLLDFIHSGSPPVAVVFGSTGTNGLKGIYQKIHRAFEASNQRAVIVGDQTGEDVPSHLFYQRGYVPYSWLFERSSAVIHHGGAGTTGKALRAGIPQIILPFTSDQPFWGRRVHKLGAGPKPIPPKRLDPEKLAKAIHTVIHNPNMRSRAEIIARAISKEDGIKDAMKIIESFGDKDG